MDKSYYFFFKALLFGIAAIVAIPKSLYKKYFLYGFMFGAVGNLIQVFTLGQMQLFKYEKMGVFGVFGKFSFWTPVAWMFAFMLFFYFLPVRRNFLYPYILAFAFFGFMVGTVLHNLGIYHFIGNYVYFAPFVYLAWFSLAALVFIRNEKISLK